MNLKGKLLILDESDIQELKRNKPFDEINQDDLKSMSFSALRTCDVAVLNINGQTTILKNRWGVDGIIIPKKIEPAKKSSWWKLGFWAFE